MEFIKKLFKANHKVIKDELNEIVNLKVDDEDLKQAEVLSDLVIGALAAYGIVIGVAFKPVIKKAIAYGIRDLKDGLNTPDRLIISRIVKELSNV